MLQRLPRQHVRHRKDEQRKGKGRADPEPPGHVDQLGIRRIFRESPSSVPEPCRRSGKNRVRSRTISGCMGQTYSVVLRRGKRRGLQRHAALRASAGLGLAHLRIHRTDIHARVVRLTCLGSLRRGVGSCVCSAWRRCRAMSAVFVLLLEPLLRIFFEFRQAVLAAEVVSLTVVLMFAGSAPWIHGHAADWVGSHVDLFLLILSLNLADARPAN